jgi:hypothetical protein
MSNSNSLFTALEGGKSEIGVLAWLVVEKAFFWVSGSSLLAMSFTVERELVL